MTLNQKQFNELSELVMLSLDKSISQQQKRRLESLLERDPAARKCYFLLINTYLGVQEPDNLKVLHDKGRDASYDPELWKALAEHEVNAPTVYVEKPKEKPIVQPVEINRVRPQREPVRFPVYTIILSAAAMILIMLMVWTTPLRQAVAVLTDSVNADWQRVKASPGHGDMLRQGTLTLSRGLAQITFDDGAVVLVEAPAVFELESPQSMFLARGKLTAVVSEVAVGFTVNTPSATIIDLGTEFGVNVTEDGSCSVHMFEGRANLIAGRKGQKKTSLTLYAAEARSVDRTTAAVSTIELFETTFVRRIDAVKEKIDRAKGVIDLADIVSGGNGLGMPDTDSVIDVTTGQISNRLQWQYVPEYDKVYHRVDQYESIDGVFVPNGRSNTQISSTGLRYDGFPETSGKAWGGLYAGAKIAFGPARVVDLGKWDNYEPLQLQGQDLSETSVIMMYSNVGVTFDLAAIGRIMAGTQLSSFSVSYGYADNVYEFLKSVNELGIGRKCQVWVLIDGELRHQKELQVPGDSSGKIDVDIVPKDRFLTIAVTDGGDEIHNDWIVLVEPVLNLK